MRGFAIELQLGNKALLIVTIIINYYFLQINVVHKVQNRPW